MIQISIYNQRAKQKLIRYRFNESDCERIYKAQKTLNKEIENTPFDIVLTEII